MRLFLMGALTLAAGFVAGLWIGDVRNQISQAAMAPLPPIDDDPEELPIVVSHDRHSAAFRRLTQRRVQREVH